MTRFAMGDMIDDEYLVIDSLIIDNKEYVSVKYNENELTFLEVYEEDGEDYIRNIEDDNEFEKVKLAFSKKAVEMINSD